MLAYYVESCSLMNIMREVESFHFDNMVAQLQRRFTMIQDEKIINLLNQSLVQIWEHFFQESTYKGEVEMKHLKEILREKLYFKS